MTTGGFRRTLAAALILTGAIVGPGPVDAQARPPRVRPVIRLLSQPIVVAPNGAFPVILSLTDAPAGGELAVDIYDRVERASDLSGAMAGRDPDVTFLPVPLGDAAGTTSQPAGFAIQLYTEGGERPPGAWSHQITEPGVYPVRVRLRNASRANVATFTTTLIRTPEPGQPSDRIAVALLPVVHADPPTDPQARTTTDVADPNLLDVLPPFLQAFADHPSVPATFAITPDTAARLDGDPDATDVAGDLRERAAGDGRQPLDAPYVDVDPGQLVATGQIDELAALRDLGRTALTEHVGGPRLGTWLLPRPVDPGTLPFLRQNGIDRLVLPAGALAGPPLRRAVTLPAGAEQISVVVAETGLADDLATAADPMLGAHQALARLTLLASDQPGAEVVLPLIPKIDAAALGVLLDALIFGTSFFEAIPLDDVFAAAVPAPPGTAARAPSAARLPGYPEAVAETSADLASYRSMTPEGLPTDAAADEDRAFARSLAFSAAVDLPAAQRTAELRSIQARASERFAGVAVPDRDKVTLGSRRARFPLPITSKLPTPVKVLVEFDANDRLDFPDEAVPVTLTGERTVVEIPVRTLTSGDTPVLITVRSPDGRVVLSKGRYTIRSTAVSGGGLVLTIGAGAFLALWWGRHWWRARPADGPRRARR